MRAIGCDRYLPLEDPKCFVQIEVPTPQPSGRDLLVQVTAVSVNPVDTKVRAAIKQGENKPVILGWDAAGIVVQIGEEASLFKPGDEVFYAGSRVRPGCNSEYHLVDERIVGHKPNLLSYEEAAALPLTSITAMEALFTRLAIVPHLDTSAPTDTLLVIGGAGGVSSMAIQLAKKVAGLRVIASASRAESAEWCKTMGADLIVNHHSPLSAELKRVGCENVAYILCLNSTESYIQSMGEVIQPQGKICAIVRSKNDQPLQMNVFFEKSVTFAWEYMFTKSVFHASDMQTQHNDLEKISRWIEQGVIRTTLNEQYGPLNVENLRKAHARIESGKMIGKLA